MRLSRIAALVAAGGLLTLNACGDGSTTTDETESSLTDAEAAGSGQQGGVRRTTQQTPEEREVDRSTVTGAIATAPGPQGVNVALETVKVTGDVLTVQVRTSAPLLKCCKSELIDVSQVSVIDDATAQQLSVLQDNQGKWLAAPLLSSDSDKIRMSLHETAVIWFKFPAPPPSTRTVSINIPQIAPFDGIPVNR